MLAHQQPQYYQIQKIPTMVWITLVTWYTYSTLAHPKILQNFWPTLISYWVGWFSGESLPHCHYSLMVSHQHESQNLKIEKDPYES